MNMSSTNPKADQVRRGRNLGSEDWPPAFSPPKPAMGSRLVHGAGGLLEAVGLVVGSGRSIMRLTTAKKNPVDQPHIRMPVRASTAPSSRESAGKTRSP